MHPRQTLATDRFWPRLCDNSALTGASERIFPPIKLMSSIFASIFSRRTNLGSDRLDDFSCSDQVDRPLHVVGQDLQAGLGTYPR